MTIRVMPDGPPNVLVLEIDGEIVKSDYTDVLLPAVEQIVAATDELRVVIVYPEYEGYAPSATWQDLKMGAEFWRKWKRIALVTDSEWMSRGLSAFAWMIPGDAKHFPTAERDAAITWAAGS